MPHEHQESGKRYADVEHEFPKRRDPFAYTRQDRLLGEGGQMVNPPTSKAQARFFRAAASGSVKKPGLSRVEAKESVAGHSTRGLPERSRRKK